MLSYGRAGKKEKERKGVGSNGAKGGGGGGDCWAGPKKIGKIVNERKKEKDFGLFFLGIFVLRTQTQTSIKTNATT